MIHEELRTYLLSKDAVSDLVGGTRIFPGIIPKGKEQPAVMYQRISSYRVRSMTGSSNLTKTRFQLSCWATLYKSAHQLAENIRLAVDGFSGVMGSTPVNAVFIEDQDEDNEPAIGSEADKRFVVRLDISIWHYESSPTL